MSRRYGPLILTLAALWGSSYLFIKVGVRDFEPTVLMTLRLLIGGLLLLGFLAATSGGRQVVSSVRGAWREGLVMGTINGAVPFTLIAWGETHIDSGVAAIANAPFDWTVPEKFVNESLSVNVCAAAAVLNRSAAVTAARITKVF